MAEVAQVDAAAADGTGIGGTFGPYVQSLRVARHQEVAEELIRSGAAYRCDCTPERLQQEREEQTARKEAVGYSGYCRDRNVPPACQQARKRELPLEPRQRRAQAHVLAVPEGHVQVVDDGEVFMGGGL